MKRPLKTALIIIVVLLALVWVFLSFLLDSTVKAAMETVLPRITGTPVRLERVNFSLLSGHGTIGGLVIGNPPGFHTSDAIRVKNASVQISVLSLLSDRIEIEDIRIAGTQVTYETGLSGSNIGAIQANVEKFAGARRAGKAVQVNHLLIEGGKIAVSATAVQGVGAIVRLPPVELSSVGSGTGGTSAGEVARKVFGTLVDAIGRAVGEVGDTSAEGSQGPLK